VDIHPICPFYYLSQPIGNHILFGSTIIVSLSYSFAKIRKDFNTESVFPVFFLKKSQISPIPLCSLSHRIYLLALEIGSCMLGRVNLRDSTVEDNVRKRPLPQKLRPTHPCGLPESGANIEIIFDTTKFWVVFFVILYRWLVLVMSIKMSLPSSRYTFERPMYKGIREREGKQISLPSPSHFLWLLSYNFTRGG